jgi:photosystem II stability/assembly factor-like uncharacterized protein
MRTVRPFSALALAGVLTSQIAAAASSAIDTERLAGLRARSIGPAGMSGRVAAIEAVESDPDTVYVGAATGGVWKSTNGGLTWKPIFDRQPVAAIGAIAVFAKNPSLVWVGTGEGNVRNSASVGNGIYKSTDAGATWTHLGLPESERIHRIALHPTDENIAWVAVLGKLWSDSSERGLYKTTDGGKSWRKVLAAPAPLDRTTGAADVALDPSNPNKVYASLWQFRRWPYKFESGGPGSGLFVSHDGGETWKRREVEDGLPEGDLGRIGLGVARSNPDVVYAMVEAKKSALYRSNDGGRTFAAVNSEPSINPRPFYFGEIRVDPRNAERVYSLEYTVRVSHDGGRHFQVLVKGEEIHGDHHALWIDPANPEHLYVGDDGGVAISADGGASNRFVSNLPLAQFYHVAYDLDVPYNVYGGLQDNGSWRGPASAWQDGGLRNWMWKILVFGDGFEALPDPENSRRGYTLWQGGNIVRWDLDKGEYKDVKPAPPAAGGGGVETPLRFNWNAALAQDPFDAATIYLGSQFVHRSTDRGATWTTLSPDLTSNKPEWQKAQESGGLTADVTNAENFTTLVTIAPSRHDKGLIWTGSDDGRIHVTRDGGKTWTSVEGAVRGVPANTWVPAIEPSTHQAATAFAVFDNHRRGDLTPYVQRTDDFGKTWKSLATPNLRGYALAIVQDPVDPELLFLGTEFGLWVSFDGGGAWAPFRHGLPTVSVMDLAIHPREHDLIVATHGRALYIVDDIRPLRHLAAETLAKPLHLFPIGAARQFRTLGEDGGFGFGAGEFRGENRAAGAFVDFVAEAGDLPLADDEQERERKIAARRSAASEPKAAEGKAAQEKSAQEKSNDEKADEAKESTATLEIRDASGALVRTLRPKVSRGVNRVAWALDRDAWKALPSDEPADPEANPGGPNVPPGTYTVKLRFRGAEASQAVEVLADPRSTNSAADWTRRWAAILESGTLRDTLVTAIERVRSARADVAVVTARVREANAERLRRREVKEKDLPLHAEAEKLNEALDALEKRLWQPPGTVGIQPESDVMTKLFYVQGYLTSSWDPPSEGHLEYLRQARTKVAAALEEVNALFAKDVAEFRERVRASGPELLPSVAPLVLPPAGAS